MKRKVDRIEKSLKELKSCQKYSNREKERI